MQAEALWHSLESLVVRDGILQLSNLLQPTQAHPVIVPRPEDGPQPGGTLVVALDSEILTDE